MFCLSSPLPKCKDKNDMGGHLRSNYQDTTSGEKTAAAIYAQDTQAEAISEPAGRLTVSFSKESFRSLGISLTSPTTKQRVVTVDKFLPFYLGYPVYYT